jgi:hypothetical protein
MNPRGRAMTRNARVLLLIGALAACSSPLPDEGSASAELYRNRCGSCHRIYQPRALKFPLWEPIVARMETYLRHSRQPLAEAERETILAYLRQHAAP